MLLLASRSAQPKAAAYALLAHALRERYAIATPPALACGRYGKPYFPSHTHIHFNLSHSGTLALCAVHDTPVGVDIEMVRPRKASLPAKVLTPAEHRWYQAQGGDWGSFYALWTRKESLCKHRGGSVLHPLTVCPPLPGEAAHGLVVTSFSGEDWRGAVCAHVAAPAILWVSAEIS